MSIQKSLPVTITYKDGKITVKGEGITATVNITSAELKKMYWKGTGSGSLDLKVD